MTYTKSFCLQKTYVFEDKQLVSLTNYFFLCRVQNYETVLTEDIFCNFNLEVFDVSYTDDTCPSAWVASITDTSTTVPRKLIFRSNLIKMEEGI